MAAPIPPALPALPVEDIALDARARIWHLITPHPSPFQALWYCPATGAGATRAHLDTAYGPVVLLASGDYAAVA